MDLRHEPERPDLTLQLPRDVYYQLIHTLRAALPTVTDTPEDRARRDNAAIAQVACLLPANADEANLAATYVAASARAMDCLRLSQEYSAPDHSFALKCDALAASTRTQALTDPPHPATAEPPSRLEPPPSPPAQTEANLAAPHPMPATGLDPEVAAEANRYALQHRKRAALIRRLGRLPDRLDCGPLSPDLIRAIATGTSSILQSLDQRARAAVAVTA